MSRQLKEKQFLIRSMSSGIDKPIAFLFGKEG